MKCLNVLILAGKDFTHITQNQQEQYPYYLTERNDVPLLEYLIKQCDELQPRKIICLLPSPEVTRYHLRNMVAQISLVASVIPVQNQTAGAACTALLACEDIDNDIPLLIMGSNEILSVPLTPAINEFKSSNADAGVFVFKSIHPRYAFVCLDEHEQVIEAAEKKPISHHAIAGAFWFRRGADFVAAVKNMIRKDFKTNGLFYIAPALNEMILNNQCIASRAIANSQYHSLRSATQLYTFETEVPL